MKDLTRENASNFCIAPRVVFVSWHRLLRASREAKCVQIRDSVLLARKGRISVRDRTIAATNLTVTAMAPNRRAGGGKKSFLKGVSRGDEPDTDVAPSEDPQEDTFDTSFCPFSDSPSQPPAPTDPPAARPSATQAQATAESGAGTGVSGIPMFPNTDVEGVGEASGQCGGGETRGQLLQRHKKVP